MIYAQLLLFLPLAAAGGWLGHAAARRRRWWVVVMLCLMVIGVVIVGRRVPRAAVLPPFSWAVDAGWNPLLMTFVVALVFSTLLPRLPAGRTGPATVVAMAVLVIYYGLLPAMFILAARPALARLQTRIDKNAICHQTTGYTCGPAAAVTCLARMGIRAQEGELAIQAHCASAFGTDGPFLAATLNQLYPAIHCAYDWFPSLDAVPLPAVCDCEIKGVGGHYVALLEVLADAVIVGDPMSGRVRLSRGQFLEEWKGTAIAFQPRQ
jgi:hypothetical protein